MTFPRDPESVPRLGQVALAAVLTMGLNVLLAFLSLLLTDPGGPLQPLVGGFFVFQWLLQWVYLLPGLWWLRHQRGPWLGMLLGGVLYTLGSCGCMLTLLGHIPD